MTVKEAKMIREALCRAYDTCSDCPMESCNCCENINELADWLTSTREKELVDWYHENVNTYINDFCKRFPNADREYVVNNICVDMIYKGHDCNDCEGGNIDCCVTHWNSLMENDDV